MIQKGDIWIKPKRILRIFGKTRLYEIEDYLYRNFVNGYPVIVPTARSGIYLIFKYYFDKKIVEVFPYASQCIVKALFAANKHACTPLENRQNDIAYHQWGYQKIYSNASRIFLEDAADSFYPIGGKVLKNESEFEIWSVSKILGTPYGGIIWCRDAKKAQYLKEIIAKSRKQNFLFESVLWRLRRFSNYFYQIWEKYQFSHLKLNIFQTRTLNYSITKWGYLYEERKELLLETNKSESNISTIKTQTLIEKNFGVIPVVIKNVSNKKSGSIYLHEITEYGKTSEVCIYPYQVLNS